MFMLTDSMVNGRFLSRTLFGLTNKDKKEYGYSNQEVKTKPEMRNKKKRSEEKKGQQKSRKNKRCVFSLKTIQRTEWIIWILDT